MNIEHRGKWIKDMIKKNGFTIQMIVDLLHIDQATIYRWFSRKDLSFAKMKRIAEILRIDLNLYFPGNELEIGKEVKDYKLLYLEALEEIKDLEKKNKNLEFILSSFRDKSGTNNEGNSSETNA